MANPVVIRDAGVTNAHEATVVVNPNLKGNQVAASSSYPLGTTLTFPATSGRGPVRVKVTSHGTGQDRHFLVSPAVAKQLHIGKNLVHTLYFTGGAGPLGDIAPGSPVPAISDTARAIQDVARSMIDFFNALFDPHFWLSVLKVTGGGILILLALAALIFGRGAGTVGKSVARKAASGTPAKVVTG